MDDVLSLNNPQFSTYLSQIYPDNLFIEPTALDFFYLGQQRVVTKTTFLNLELSLLFPTTGKFKTEFSWKRDVLNLGTI